MAKVTLDVDTFKALASTTRLAVLRALDERRKTVTELARELELNKATVHEHIQLLTATGLIKKKDEGRKWIYYELTWRGERLLHPQETTTFAVLLGISVASLGGGVAMLGKALEWWWAEHGAALQPGNEDGSDEGGSVEETAPVADQNDAEMAGAPSGNGTAELGGGGSSDASVASESGFGEDGWIAIALFVTAVLMTVLGYIIRKRR